jgi:hypothetical protein
MEATEVTQRPRIFPMDLCDPPWDLRALCAIEREFWISTEPAPAMPIHPHTSCHMKLSILSGAQGRAAAARRSRRMRCFGYLAASFDCAARDALARIPLRSAQDAGLTVNSTRVCESAAHALIRNWRY